MKRESGWMRVVSRRMVGIRTSAAVLGIGLALALAACSAGGSGLSQLPLTGLGADTGPSSPPTVTGTGPGGQYAFVYGNQIWIKPNSPSAPKQLTHMVIQAGAYIAWGPLVWSPGGHSIAFVLLQDTSGGHPARSTGPLYVANVDNGSVDVVPGTGSITGHGYAWYGDNALFYADPSGISFVDLSDPSNPRSWTVAAGQDGPSFNGNTATFYAYTDIGFVGQSLLATQLAITNPGAVGQIGQAQLVRFYLNVAPGDYAGGSMNIGRGGLFGYSVNDLGQAYADADGTWHGGSWQIGPNASAVIQQVTGVDPKAGTVSSTICYDNYYGNGCDQQLFQQVSKQPFTSIPQFAFSPDGSAIAMTGVSLAVQRTDGSGFASSTPAASGMPEWSGDGKVIAATQVVPASPDSAGVIHYDTNIVTYPGGGKGSVAIANAQDLSWAP